MRKPRTLLIIVGIVAVVALMFGLFGCSSPNDPIKLPPTMPTESQSASEKPTAAPMTTSPRTTPPAAEPTDPVEDSTPEPTSNPEPAPATSEAGTPATQFAQRWGNRYRDIPEFAILKAANGTCRIIEEAGPGWNDNPLVKAGIEAAVQASGLSQNDAVEFAQDADQNYCASVSNPT